MKTAIVAFDKLANPTRSAVRTGGDVRKLYNQLRADRQALDGLTVVELWTEDHGQVARYFASTEPAPTKNSKKGSK